MPQDEEADLLTPAEVAGLCRVTKTTVFRWVADGEINAIRLGKRVVRFHRADVDRFISKEAS
jgi:excisionase family DNA binding protein